LVRAVAPLLAPDNAVMIQTGLFRKTLKKAGFDEMTGL
jgi:hypothetical protein